MKKLMLITVFLMGTLFSFSQNVYHISKAGKSNEVKRDTEIPAIKLEPVFEMYVKVQKYGNGKYNVQILGQGKVVYSGIFKLQSISQTGNIFENYKYVKIDGNDVDYLITKTDLEIISTSGLYSMEQWIIINYRASIAWKILFE